MGEVQIVTNSDKRLLDRNAEKYIVCEEYLDRCDLQPIMQYNYTVLADKLSAGGYLKEKIALNERSERWVEMIADAVGNHYGLNYNDIEKKYIYKPFLRDFIEVVSSIYEKAKMIVREDVFLVMHPTKPSSRTTVEASGRLIHSMDYHSSIWGDVLNFFGKKCIEKDTNVKKAVRMERALRYLAQNPKVFLAKLKGNIGKNNSITDIALLKEVVGDVVVIGSRMPKDLEQYIEEKSDKTVRFYDALQFQALENNVLAKHEADFRFRSSLCDKTKCKDELDEILKRIIPKYIPISLIEANSDINEKAMELSETMNARKIYHSAQGWDLLMHMMAIEKNKGAKICDIQHSATYAVDYFQGYEEYEMFDRFITWGWKGDSNKSIEFHDVAMNRLPKSIDKPVEKTKKLLMTSSKNITIAKYKSGYYYGSYSKRQKEFVEALPERLRRRLVIRTDITDLDSDFGIWCRKKYPYIRFESLVEKPFVESLMESDLLISDYNGSTHIEALLLGKPFVIFDGVKIIRFNTQMESLLNRMKRVGIYKESGRELAEELGKHEDFNEWFSDSSIQQVYEELKCLTTGLNKDLRRAWLEELTGD